MGALSDRGLTQVKQGGGGRGTCGPMQEPGVPPHMKGAPAQAAWQRGPPGQHRQETGSSSPSGLGLGSAGPLHLPLAITQPARRGQRPGPPAEAPPTTAPVCGLRINTRKMRHVILLLGSVYGAEDHDTWRKFYKIKWGKWAGLGDGRDLGAGSGGRQVSIFLGLPAPSPRRRWT